jgi:metallo-beta-lactamase class B
LLSATDKGNIKDADLKAWPVTVGKVKKRFMNAKIVIPGHSNIGDNSIFDYTIKIAEMN